MLRQVTQKVEELRRLIDGSASSKFLLAVSGGMDSMCLLDLFSNVLHPSEYAVAHCNFLLRGEESDGDQALVEDFCRRLGVEVFVRHFDTESYARENGISIEMAARNLRYEWFGQLCKEHGLSVLVVAHNANDNAETLMLNLLRGTGLKGLHGMDTLSPAGCASGSSILVFRPLLEFTRKQIEGYVMAHKVPYRHDSSNFSSDYKRNKIRNDVFPVFEKINPSFIRTLNREIGYFAEAGQIVDDWCCAQLPSVIVTPELSPCHPAPSLCNPESLPGHSGTLPGHSERPLCHSEQPLCHSERSEESPTTIHISIPSLLSTPHWRYLLYYILEPYGFNSQTLASVENLLESDRTISGKRFESPSHQLLMSRDLMKVLPLEQGDTLVSDNSTDDFMVVRGAGTYNVNGTRFTVEVLSWTPEMPLKQPEGTLIFDADKLRFPFVCRRWRMGDWLVPFGMHGKKKVSDLFADLKYDALAKDLAVIVVDTQSEGLAEQQHIAALLGKRMDGRYSVVSSTKTIIRISLI